MLYSKDGGTKNANSSNKLHVVLGLLASIVMCPGALWCWHFIHGSWFDGR